jgi:DNA-directed RNA polymerase sigma subunit (sigma70/sigma32)
MPDVLDTEDPLQAYQREVSKVPPIDAAEEARCIEQIRASDEMADAARKRLVEAHLGCVIALAKVYETDRIHILHLIEQGNKGLMAAVKDLGQLDTGTFWEFAKPVVQSSLHDLVLSKNSQK